MATKSSTATGGGFILIHGSSEALSLQEPWSNNLNCLNIVVCPSKGLKDDDNDDENVDELSRSVGVGVGASGIDGV